VVAGSKLNKVLIDGGSGLNVLFTKTLKKIKPEVGNGDHVTLNSLSGGIHVTLK
jgi:hypothetical protein